MRTTPDEGRKRIDLSVPQVAGSALAAVVAAKLASYFGVYGTILGAGIVSIVATCGGSLFQHFFKRTGQQLRDATVTARPREEAPPVPGEFGEGTVYRARVRSWRRPVVAAAVVFGVTMAGITTYELVSGSSFSGGTGTTVSDAVSRHGSSSSSSDSPSKSDGRPTPSGTPSRGHAPDAGGGTTHGASPTPGGSPSEEPSGGPSPSPTPTPSTSAATPTPPEPSASSRSGTAVPDQGGPSAQ
ncbi:hypothetical protein [Streptomyces yokosukanensis]|uniref:hypothetical protein n=1 Tax=Streptomyces yokosukanensis TaxID=67386 RepID=UPI00099E8AFC|nr:hypothetical protein [Streptomyces yokosukanensis]